MTRSDPDDTVAITRVLQLYFDAIDEKNYALLEHVFAANAVLRYSLDETTGPGLSARDMIARIRDFTGAFRFTQHLSGPPSIEIDGDAARARTNLRAIHVQQRRDGSRSAWLVYGVYRDGLARTSAGWRIRERVFRVLYTEGELLGRDEVESYPTPPWS